MTTTQLELGWAHLSASTQLFLDRCEAVTRWLSDNDDEVAVFEFDPMIEVWTVPPGVFFDLDDAPAEVIQLSQKLS
jgi:hypothetical protein